MVPPVPLGCHAQGLTVYVGPPSSAYQKQGRSLAQLNIDKGLRLPGAGERDPSRRDDKVGEVDVNRPVMVVEFNE